MDGHLQHPLAVPLVNRFRQASRLPAEHEHYVRRKLCIPIRPPAFRAEEERCAEGGELSFESVPAGPDAQVDVLPVVEAGTADLPLIERKAERLDEMQRRTGGEARTARISGVPMNLRLE